jgi:hypothetical protein
MVFVSYLTFLCLFEGKCQPETFKNDFFWRKDAAGKILRKKLARFSDQPMIQAQAA